MATGVPLEELPSSVLYDVFEDSASVLTGLYLERERGASDPSEAADWWAKVTTLREQMRAMDPDDRSGLVDRVTRWRREAADLTP